MTRASTAAHGLKKQPPKRRLKLIPKSIPYLPGLYSNLRDPKYAADYIVDSAKTGDETVLRLAVSDLIRTLRNTPHLPDWNTCAKFFTWHKCAAAEKSRSKGAHKNPLWVFSRSKVPLRVLFDSLCEGLTVDEFVTELSVSGNLAHAVIDFARKHSPKGFYSRNQISSGEEVHRRPKGIKSVSMRELVNKTAELVRSVASNGEILVTERGRIIAKIVSAHGSTKVPYFARRVPSQAFSKLDRTGKTGSGTDATEVISKDREDRL